MHPIRSVGSLGMEAEVSLPTRSRDLFDPTERRSEVEGLYHPSRPSAMSPTGLFLCQFIRRGCEEVHL